MRTFLAAALVIGLFAVLPASSQQAQTNPAAQTPADAAKPAANSAQAANSAPSSNSQADADKGKDSTIVFSGRAALPGLL